MPKYTKIITFYDVNHTLPTVFVHNITQGEIPDFYPLCVAEAGPQRSSWAPRTHRASGKGWH